MARPIKHGLDYFPMDVDFFEDDKIQFVSSRFDEKGELIAVKLLCKIFKAGYFIRWDNDTAFLFSKGAGRNITPSLANDVVNELIRRDFFHKGLFERFSVLTSNGIQKRYIKICTDAKRKDWKIEENFDLKAFTPEETKLTTSETRLTPVESTQRKVKESKGKKSNERAPTSKSSFLNFPKEKRQKSEKPKKIFVPPELIEVENFFSERGLNPQAAKLAFDFYSSADWHDSQGNPVLNWHQKMISWISREQKTNGNGTHQQASKQSIVRKSAGAEQLLDSLKNDLASIERSGS
jgi:hypothetical protein